MTDATPVLRIARPTNDLDALERMYAAGLGFEVVGRFEDHDGYDGVMLGTPGGPYHLEFTRRRGERAGRAPSDEHLLVFYVPDRAAWEARCARMADAGFTEVAPSNPYWAQRGRTFEDADGYRVVIQNASW